MSYLNELPERYQQWKGWRTSKKISDLGFIPSITSVKYPLHTKFTGIRVLNVGCGGSTYEAPNVINTDLHSGKGVNVVCDLSVTPMPFNDNEFDLIIANHILEHVPNWFDCFKELCRIVKVGGRIEVWVPPISGNSAFAYRDHINCISHESFMGTKGFNRPGTNLNAANEYKKKEPIMQVELCTLSHRPSTKWWIWFAPPVVLNWMSTYLRNITSEEGYFFIKR